jgi:uncharacterized protein
MILIDSSFLYAIYNAGDENHQRAMESVISMKDIPLVPEVVLPEIAYLFIRDVGYFALERFLGEFANAQIELQNITISDIRRAHEIMKTYPDAKFDLVDTCIMALSERLQITKICTFDRRDFSIFRPKHCDYLELLP